ncbi:hypothetical protein SBA2_160018 [Acidobacteriia bacterium SbA2]|nr:hypothetical protein SBA2_160018 [Acidobacteriia bacterium SbA2]
MQTSRRVQCVNHDDFFRPLYDLPSRGSAELILLDAAASRGAQRVAQESRKIVSSR